MRNAIDEDSDYSEIDMDKLDNGSSDEIQELFDNFQLMFLSLKQYRKSKLNIRELYESLLPAALLALFHHEDIREIRPGDTAVAEGRVLEIEFVSGGDDNAKEYIQGRNRLIAQILNLLESMNMIVTELEYDHISAIRVLEDEKLPEGAFDEEIRTIRSMYREGSGVDEIIVNEYEGEFCYVVTGIRGSMKICIEQMSSEDQEA